jgi:hypothetical protein
MRYWVQVLCHRFSLLKVEKVCFFNLHSLLNGEQISRLVKHIAFVYTPCAVHVYNSRLRTNGVINNLDMIIELLNPAFCKVYWGAATCVRSCGKVWRVPKQNFDQSARVFVAVASVIDLACEFWDISVMHGSVPILVHNVWVCATFQQHRSKFEPPLSDGSGKDSEVTFERGSVDQRWVLLEHGTRFLDICAAQLGYLGIKQLLRELIPSIAFFSVVVHLALCIFEMQNNVEVPLVAVR